MSVYRSEGATNTAGREGLLIRRHSLGAIDRIAELLGGAHC